MKRIVIFLFVAMCSGLLANAQINLQNGLVAYYPFNGNTNDESGSGNNASLNSATLTSSRFLINNNAYLFNGTDSKINAPSSASWNFGSGDFCVSAWINATSIGTARIVSSGYEADGLVWALGLGSNAAWGSGIRMNFYNFTTWFVDYNSNEITYTVGEWAHIAIVKSGTLLTFYFNNAPCGTATISTVSNSNSILTIGARQIWNADSFTEFFNGKIDDIRIYNRALNTQEIHAIYTQPGPEGVAVNKDGTAPDANAMLDVKANDKGILIPRIDFNDRPTYEVTNGLLIYVIANGPQGNNAFYYYDGSSWVKLAVSK
jgi:hypothetical protein